MIGELGDILWYVAQVAKALDVSLQEVAERNLSKLAHRHTIGAIHGEGSER